MSLSQICPSRADPISSSLFVSDSPKYFSSTSSDGSDSDSNKSDYTHWDDERYASQLHTPYAREDPAPNTPGQGCPVRRVFQSSDGDKSKLVPDGASELGTTKSAKCLKTDRDVAVDALAVVMFEMAEQFQFWGVFRVLRQACKRLHQNSFYNINSVIATPASVPSSLPRLTQSSAWLTLLDLRQLHPSAQLEMSFWEEVLLPDTLVDLNLGLHKPSWDEISRLSNLTFLGMAVWDDGGLDFEKAFPKLEAAEISEMSVNASGLSHSPSLKSLSVARAADLAAILETERLAALQAIQVREQIPSITLLSWCQLLSGRLLTALCVHLSDTERVNMGQLLSSLSQLSDLSLTIHDVASAHGIVPHLTTLTRIQMNLTEVTGSAYQLVHPLKELRVLITNAAFTTFQLAWLECKHLEVLHIGYGNSAQFCQLPFLSRFPFLEDLALAFTTPLSFASPYCDMQALLKLPRLQTLRLEVSAPEAGLPSIMTPQLLSTIISCTSLSSLSLLSMGVTDDSVGILARASTLRKLRELHLEGNTVTQAGLLCLSSLTNLTCVTP